MGKRRQFPAHVTWETPSGTWNVTLFFRVLDGAVMCSGLQIKPAFPTDPPGPFTRAVLQGLPLQDLISQAQDAYGQELRDLLPPAHRGSLPLTYSSPGRGRPPMDDTVLQEVARVYAASHAAPTRAVAEAFGKPYSTAASWVRMARERGFLKETSPGRRSGLA